MDIQEQKKRGLNASTLKTIAIIGMTIDHIGNVFIDQIPLPVRCILILFGGLTFPIMAFLLTEGYKHTRNFKKYTLRLLVFAAIALLPFVWAFQAPVLNVIFTLLFGLLGIYLYDHMKKRPAFWLVFAGLTLITFVCDWPLMGVPMILCYHLINNPKKRVIIPAVIPMFVMSILTLLTALLNPEFSFAESLPNLLFAFIGCTATIFLLLRYNGEKGNAPRYFFHIYYPGHLALFALLRGILFGIWF